MLHRTKTRQGIWNSRLARRLVLVFVAIAVIPLAITLLLIEKFGKELIVSTGSTMAQINRKAVHNAGEDFQRLGSAALGRSNTRVAAISVEASRSVSQKWKQNQAQALTATANDFTHLTQSSFDGAMHQSLATNQQILKHVNHETDDLLARSAQETARRSAGRVETAMLDQIEARMQERSRQLSQQFSDHIQNHLNYLALTSEMLDLRGKRFDGQKPVLDALVRRYPMLTEVSVMDRTGQEIAASAPDRLMTAADLADRSQTAYFRAGLHDETYVGVEDLPREGHAPILRLAVPIEMYRGRVSGVLAARLSLDDLWDGIRNTRIGRNGFALVTDSRGAPLLPHPSSGPLLQASADISLLHWRIVVAQPRVEVMEPIAALRRDILEGAHTASLQMHTRIQSSSRAASSDLQSKSQRLRETTTHEIQARTRGVFDRLAAQTAHQTNAELVQMQSAIRRQSESAQRDNGRQMAVAAATTSAHLAGQMAPLTAQALHRADRRLTIFAVAVVALTSAVGCVIALLLAGKIVWPIVRLAHGTRAIASGELERRVDERAPDEIGDLAVAFNLMAASLQQSQSELRETESQLIQSAKLASLGTLSAGVAHELNQPVAIVRGIAQQIQDDASLPEDVKEDLRLIEGQTSRMMKIIKHLRTFCRAGGYEMSEVNVNQVVQDCFILIESQLKAHNIGITLDLCPETMIVTGDANELEQVFLNLITNARDAMEGTDGAQFFVRTRLEKQQCILEFADNGSGIPEELLSRIFDPFFTTKEAGKGTGLGLSISHGIIEKHHGQLTVKNDHGAVFTISLPCAEDSAQEQPLALAA